MSSTSSFSDFEMNFESKVRVLKSLKPLDSYQVREAVEVLQSKINVVVAAKQCRLTLQPELKTIACQLDDDEYCRRVVELLAEELPVLDPEEYLDDGRYYLMADIVGMNCWREEEVQELISHPEAYDLDYSLTAFLELIAYGIDDEEPWSICTEYFSWPISTYYAIHTYGFDLDHRFIKRTLKKHGAPAEVYTMVMLTLFPPDNPLLSTTSDDWECDPSCMDVEINTENIRLLRKQWKQAKPLITQLGTAREWVADNPWIIPILGECLEESQPRKKERVRVRA